MLRRVSTQLTEVDGKVIEAGEEAHVRPGTTVRLAQVLTLRFLGSDQGHSARDAVTLQHGADPRADTVALRGAAGSIGDPGEAGGSVRARAQGA